MYVVFVSKVLYMSQSDIVFICSTGNVGMGRDVRKVRLVFGI